jgi:RHS repeat-associated protein
MSEAVQHCKPFTGKERDAETGLDYFGARYFSAAEGRFTSPDPGAYKIEDPRTFNRYAYVNNNPLKYVDPTGREASYVIDWKKKTITFYVTVTIWGPDADEEYIKKFKKEVESAWSGKYRDKKSGIEFGVSTKAHVSLYNNGIGEGRNARNGFYIGDDVGRSSFNNTTPNTRFFGMYTGGLNPGQEAESHELQIGRKNQYLVIVSPFEHTNAASFSLSIR